MTLVLLLTRMLIRYQTLASLPWPGEELGNAAFESRQHITAGDFFRLFQHLMDFIRLVDGDEPIVRVHEPNHWHTESQVFLQPPHDFLLTVGRGADLDNEPRRSVAVFPRHGVERLVIDVIADVGAANGVRVVFNDQARVVGANLPITPLAAM